MTKRTNKLENNSPFLNKYDKVNFVLMLVVFGGILFFLGYLVGL